MNCYTRELCDFWKQYKPRFVKINTGRLAYLAEDLFLQKPTIPDWQTPELPLFSQNFISHLFYICAIDFAFTHFAPPYRSFSLSPTISGSAAASMCFLRHFGNNPISAERMMAIALDETQLGRFFQGLNLPPLLSERGTNLAETAAVLKTHFDGNPLNLLQQSRYDPNRLIQMLIKYFPIAFGSDYYRVNAKTQGNSAEQLIFPNKRAQLFALIYHGRAVHSSGALKPLQNAEDIGPIADYQVPKYLRAVGVLEYAHILDKKIDCREILPFGSTEEMEIRVATVYAVCELMRLTGLIMPALDHFLWTEGQKVKHLNHHLTPTTAY